MSVNDGSGGYSVEGQGRETSNMPVIFATAGYDHTIRFWQPHTRLCNRTIQHVDSQVSARAGRNENVFDGIFVSGVEPTDGRMELCNENKRLMITSV